MGLPRPGRPLLLLVLLPAAASCFEGPCPLPCRCQGQLLDCRHAGLATIPPATRRHALFTLDFTSNSISSIKKQAWREYPWAESLVLQNNNLQAVKRHSLEGLFLLRHLDLSFNKILSLEGRAFEPLPFLQLINLSGNFITQIQNGTFQAWHGMQFLQKLILSHNPLSVIADTSFFNLPFINYLNLGGTRVTRQALIRVLLRTLHLETLKLSGNVACCLCQENNITETPCVEGVPQRTVEFRCKKVCSNSTSQCDPLPETQGLKKEALQSGKLKASTMSNLSPKETLLGDQEIVTLRIVLSLASTDSDLSKASDHNSRTNSYPPQHPSRQESKTSKELRQMLRRIQHTHQISEIEISKLYFLENLLMAELKKLHKPKIIVTVKSTVSPLPVPAAHVQEVRGIPAVKGQTARGWVRKQRDVGLNPAALNPYEAAAEAPHLSRSFEIYSDTMEQSEKTPGMEDVEKVEGAEEALPPRQDEQRLNTNQHFLYNPLINSPLTASSTLEDTAEEENPSLRGYFPAIPQTTETHWKQRKEESSFLNNSSSSNSPDDELVQGDLFETKVNHHLRFLVPNKAVRAFIARVARALKMDCHHAKLQVSCAKMISKTGMLIKMLSERQNNQVASALREQCPQEENVPNGTTLAKETGGKVTKELEVKHTVANGTLLAMVVSVLIMAALIMACLFETCSRRCANVFQFQSTGKSRPRRHYKKKLLRGQRKKDGVQKQGPPEPEWLRDLYQPLTSQQEKALAQLRDTNTSEEEEEIFNKAQLR
ncbi:PREDICTED: leucine-rich repeat-containing protein 37A-like [Calidris pugnax]|uniref:leucine-rich repeat-containing protein 37A-like n=1 Tax=Calidris pugnax TaxID=198806 RepID=UPI00071D21D6|nr:PREDICTED: leucine-rich repeat-containing protein 37A-like [Calidris pugnax]